MGHANLYTNPENYFPFFDTTKRRPTCIYVCSRINRSGKFRYCAVEKVLRETPIWGNICWYTWIKYSLLWRIALISLCGLAATPSCGEWGTRIKSHYGSCVYHESHCDTDSGTDRTPYCSAQVDSALYRSWDGKISAFRLSNNNIWRSGCRL